MQDAWAAKLSAAGSVIRGKLYVASKASGEGIGADATGNVFLTGDHQGEIDFGGGALDNTFGPNVYIAKLDSLGKEILSPPRLPVDSFLCKTRLFQPVRCSRTAYPQQASA
jgi:hypothetical protein